MAKFFDEPTIDSCLNEQAAKAGRCAYAGPDGLDACRETCALRRAQEAR